MTRYEHGNYPSSVGRNAYGDCLLATLDLEPGTIVARFEGPRVLWDDVPESELCHALLLEDGLWLVPETTARYVNHSCAPNCAIDDELFVRTTSFVRRGDELTFSYNSITAEEATARPEDLFWDDRWTFQCQCGAANCAGLINGYRVVKEAKR